MYGDAGCEEDDNSPNGIVLIVGMSGGQVPVIVLNAVNL